MLLLDNFHPFTDAVPARAHYARCSARIVVYMGPNISDSSEDVIDLCLKCYFLALFATPCTFGGFRIVLVNY